VVQCKWNLYYKYYVFTSTAVISCKLWKTGRPKQQAAAGYSRLWMCSETKSCSALANPRIITQNFIVQFLCKIKYSYKDAKIWNWTSTDKNTDIHLHFLSLTNKPHMKRMHVLTDWRVLAICCTTNRMSSSSCSNEGENAISPASFTSSMQSCGKSPLLDSSNRSTHEFMVRVSTSFSWRVAQIHLLVWLLFVYYAKRQHNTKKTVQ